jgi:hypothetical protein
MTKAKQLKPVPAARESAGLYDNDLKDLGLEKKEGSWIRIQYQNSGITKKVRTVEKSDGWQNDLIFLHRDDLKALHLLDQVGQAGPTNPPQNVLVTVSKLSVPREWKAYLVFATFLLAVGSAVIAFQASTSSPISVPLTLAAATLVLTVITAMVSLAAAYLQKQ